MKWIVADFVLGAWLVPFFIAMLMIVAIVGTRMGSVDNSARYEAQAAESRAREAEARAAEAQADGMADAHQAWAGNLPIILLVLGAGVVISIATLYRGKAHVEAVKIHGALALAGGTRPQIEATPQPATQNVMINVIPENMLALLEQYAQTHDKQLQTDGADYFLVDNTTGEAQRVKPKQLTG